MKEKKSHHETLQAHSDDVRNRSPSCVSGLACTLQGAGRGVSATGYV